MDISLTAFPDRSIDLFEPFKQTALNTVGDLAVGYDVLRYRVAPTLHKRVPRPKLAKTHGCTAAGIRSCEEQFRQMVKKPDVTVRRLVTKVRERYGPAIPIDMLYADSRKVAQYVLSTVGPWKLQDGWLTAPNGDPTGRIIEQATATSGQVDPEQAAAALTDWGVPPEWHQQWLTSRRRLRTVPSGDLVVWTPAIHRYTYGLTVLARPASLEEIQQTIGCTATSGSAKNVLREADNIVRVGGSRWALTEWGYRSYTTIPDAIAHTITEIDGDGAQPRDIIRQVSEQFGVKDSSISLYLGAPRFVRTEDGRIRLRTADDPWTWRTDPPGARQGVFPHPGRTAVTLLVAVDRNLRAGSGRRLPILAAQHLGIVPGDTVPFVPSDGHGPTVKISWPDSSMRGPGLSTLRVYCVDSRDGDLLRLILDRDRGEFSAATVTADAVHTAAADPDEAWRLAVRLVGLPSDPDESVAGWLPHVTAAVGAADTAGLIEELETRGDHTISRLLEAALAAQPV